ncbi:CBS domain-containing protein [uncultured Limnohabitans sp.]|uniref:CBS domain-containing protein n=1 Tax=uncultured Limnohabitans sp. TaxID=768543 RepID=UPI002617853D|nr:CBS domain-containing protein [uncultured Limnohabitans sp.]
MNLSELCQRDILTLSAEASVRKAAEMMRTHHVGALALTDPEDPTCVVGVVTDRDLVINLLSQDRSPEEQNIGAFSTVHLIRVPGTATVHEAVQAMNQHGVRRLFITEPNGRLMGLLSIDDLLVTLADELSGLSQALRIGIDLESSRTSPMFNPTELSGGMYLAQHEP